MLSQVDLNIGVRNTLVKFLGVWSKCLPPPIWAPGRWSNGQLWFSSPIVPQCSGRCSLCQGASFALLERWDFPSLAVSALGTYPYSHTGPIHMKLTQRKRNPKTGPHQSHNLSSSPKATCSLFLLLRAKERFLWTSAGLFGGLREGASPKGLTLLHPFLQPTSDHHLSCTATKTESFFPSCLPPTGGRGSPDISAGNMTKKY